MKLLTVTILTIFSTIINAAGGDGVVGSPQSVISMTEINENSTLVCFKAASKNDINCAVINH